MFGELGHFYDGQLPGSSLLLAGHIQTSGAVMGGGEELPCVIDEHLGSILSLNGINRLCTHCCMGSFMHPVC